jgi:hypothetical protein
MDLANDQAFSVGFYEAFDVTRMKTAPAPKTDQIDVRSVSGRAVAYPPITTTTPPLPRRT